MNKKIRVSKLGIIGFVAIVICLAGISAKTTNAEWFYSGFKYKMPVTISNLQGFTEISTGTSHACAVTNDNILRCWGKNDYGQLGNGNSNDSLIPVKSTLINNVISVSEGSSHTCAALNNGTIKCWGFNFNGQLGDGTTTSSLIPVKVYGINNAVKVSTDFSSNCAVLSDGTIKCWGSNLWGNLGDGSTIERHYAVNVTGITNAIDVSVGSSHTCAVLNDGTVKCWGRNDEGQLGTGNVIDSYIPVSVQNLNNATSVSTGYWHTCAVMAKGNVKCWGYNAYGELGDGTNTNKMTPVNVSNINNAVDIALGWYHSCALLSDGSIKCWGRNNYGQLGDGTNIGKSIPVLVQGINNAVAISGGDYYTCALLKNGTIKCWGNNYYGELGDGTNISKNSPVDVLFTENLLKSSYEIKLEINTSSFIANGKMQADCDDIRFSDDIVEFNYWIQSGCNTNNTIIWLNLTNIADATKRVFMYYGNSTAISNQLNWNGKYFFLSESSCTGDYTYESVFDGKYIRGASNFGGTGNGIHNHTVNCTLAQDSGYFGNGYLYSGDYSREGHTHSFSTKTDNVINEFPYTSFIVCSTNKLKFDIDKISLFKHSILPKYWSRITLADNKLIKGSNTYGLSKSTFNQEIYNINGTTNSITLTTGAYLGASGPNPIPSSHNHTVSFQTTVENNVFPPYITAVLAKTNISKHTPEKDIIIMVNLLPPIGWELFSQGVNKFIMSAQTAGNEGGSLMHNHQIYPGVFTSVNGETTGPNTVTPPSSITMFSTSHAHNITSCTFSNASNLPPYIDVILIKEKNSPYYYNVNTSAEEWNVIEDIYPNNGTSDYPTINITAKVNLWCKIAVTDVGYSESGGFLCSGSGTTRLSCKYPFESQQIGTKTYYISCTDGITTHNANNNIHFNYTRICNMHSQCASDEYCANDQTCKPKVSENSNCGSSYVYQGLDSNAMCIREYCSVAAGFKCNAPPDNGVPYELANITTDTQLLNWSPGYDPLDSIYYNIRIGTLPGSSNAGFYTYITSTEYQVNNLNNITTYYWSIQTCDSIMQCSSWSVDSYFSRVGLPLGSVCNTNSECISNSCATNIDGQSKVCVTSGECNYMGSSVVNGYNVCFNNDSYWCNSGTWQSNDCGTNTVCGYYKDITSVCNAGVCVTCPTSCNADIECDSGALCINNVCKLNDIPIISYIEITPTPAKTTQNISCEWKFIDQDTPRLNFTVHWYKNNAIFKIENVNNCANSTICKTGEISSLNTSTGDVWRCNITTNDRGDIVKALKVIIIEQSPPILKTFPQIYNDGMSAQSRAPYTNDVVECVSGEYYDSDNNPMIASEWRWYVNGNILTSETLQYLNLSIPGNGNNNDIIMCSQRVQDSSSMWSAWYNSSTVEINGSMPLIVENITIFPQNTKYRTGDILNFSAIASDPDNQQYKLYVCKTNKISLTGCEPGKEFCVSVLTNSDTRASCLYNTSKDNITENPAMINYYAYVCDTDSKCSNFPNINNYFYLYVQGIELQLVNGWNLISFPVKAYDENGSDRDYTAEEVLQLINGEIIARYNTTSKKYITHIKNMSINNFIIDIGESYYVYINETKNVTLEGKPVTNISKKLKRGWNFINYPEDVDVFELKMRMPLLKGIFSFNKGVFKKFDDVYTTRYIAKSGNGIMVYIENEENLYYHR